MAFPRPLADYGDVVGSSLVRILAARVEAEPFNAIATGIFVLAIVHTFAAARFTALAHRVQRRHDAARRADGHGGSLSVAAELLHFLGEIEVVFGIWAVVLLIAMAGYAGLDTARHYLNDTVNYTEAMFVVVIMTMASTRPVVSFAESGLRRLANAGGGTPAAWWATILRSARFSDRSLPSPRR